MARLVSLKDSYRVAFGNDPDADRHGIVTPQLALALHGRDAHQSCLRMAGRLNTLVASFSGEGKYNGWRGDAACIGVKTTQWSRVRLITRAASMRRPASVKQEIS
jgi:hypothetical protein